MLGGFAAAAAGGTGLLLLPGATERPGGASFIEALFTAVSALCVTGLVVVDTPGHWSSFGECVILVLIQIGGLGVMTTGAVIGLAVARRLSLRTRLTAAAEAGGGRPVNAPEVILGVLRITVLTEAAVAVILTLQFALTYGMPWDQASWYGVFHAVSAFNNAGFSLFSDNLAGFAADPVVCLSISAAVILGGLGFPVLMQLRRRPFTPLAWSLNTRLVLLGTGVLLAAGTLLVLLVESGNPRTLGPLNWPARLLAAFFQSVQTRTAGFSSINIGEMDPLSWLGMDLLMFIGGGPAGTAGGIKVTTFMVLIYVVAAELRGGASVTMLGKRLGSQVPREAITMLLAAAALVLAATGFLMAVTDFGLDVLLLETTSAFGTVGLSAGISAAIGPVGQSVLVVLMFVGRLGPLLLAAGLALRSRRSRVELPEERPIIG